MEERYEADGSRRKLIPAEVAWLDQAKAKFAHLTATLSLLHAAAAAELARQHIGNEDPTVMSQEMVRIQAEVFEVFDQAFRITDGGESHVFSYVMYLIDIICTPQDRK